jgi:aspartate/glutamate racemase
MAILERAIAEFQTEEVELIIAGCTELAIAFNKMGKIPIAWIDPLDVLAKLTLDRAFSE